MNQEWMQQYARFAVRVGVNPQPQQTLIIRAPLEGAFFARACAEQAYLAGVHEVVVHYSDEKLSRISMQYKSIETLQDIKPWVERSFLDYVESDGGACVLNIVARDPEIYKGIDPHKVDLAGQASQKSMQRFREYTMKDRIQWSIVAIPSEAWASKVFPGCDAQQAQEKLWQAIFEVCRVTNGDVVNEWTAHVEKMMKKRDKLNALALDRLHLKSENGTDVVIGLADTHVWEGAQSHTPEGYAFIANIPTEEVFTAPHKDRVDGVVKGTKPYVYNGNVIEDFSVTFEKGKVVAYSAKTGEELLGRLLDTDEGARHIGEIALVPVTSPINQSGLLFFNTLFDENAACHIAFGAGYPGTVKNGTTATEEELLSKGVNHSLVHEDVMIGSADMQITGITKTGETVLIFEQGDWAI